MPADYFVFFIYYTQMTTEPFVVKLRSFFALSHALSELVMVKLLDVLNFVLEEKWLSPYEHARVLAASCRRADAQQIALVWRDLIELRTLHRRAPT